MLPPFFCEASKAQFNMNQFLWGIYFSEKKEEEEAAEGRLMKLGKGQEREKKTTHVESIFTSSLLLSFVDGQHLQTFMLQGYYKS